tara:strand:+ start:36 stop:1220 length:1185 start_codon:yes stop_codon:yes gene_type:complete
MAATQKGVWDLQDVRDKQLQSEWTYSAPSGDNGALWTWGSSQYGQLGLNNNTSLSSPMQVGSDGTWDTFTNGGDSHAVLGMKGDGTLWAWGKNNNGELGQNEQGPTSIKSSPVQIPGTWSDHNSRGNYTKGAIKSGELYVWGDNQTGECGQNSTSDANISSPTQVGTGSDWSQIDGLDNSGAAGIKTDGTLWVWGANHRGQLGLNTMQSEPGGYSSPTQIPGTWSKCQGSYHLTMGLKPDGSLWSWGSNSRGQLGHNEASGSPTTGNYSSPMQIPGTWSDFSASGNAGFGIKPDGTIWSWGNNQNGPLGQNAPTPSWLSSPTQIGSDTTWSVVGGTAYAIKTDGTFWAWGTNNYGEKGLNDLTKRSSPTQVGGASNWLRMAGGSGDHMGAIREL